MRSKRVLWRGQAHDDVASIIAWYLQEAGQVTALRLVEALDAVDQSIGEFPALGSARHSSPPHKGLRFRKVDGYPFLVFYLEGSEHIEIIRVLHESRDIPRHMRGDDAMDDR